MLIKIMYLKKFKNFYKLIQKDVGESTFSIIKNKTYIHNIFIKEHQRNKKYGSELLKYIEDFSKQNKVTEISLLAKQETHGNLTDFYKKQGYKISGNESIYDDGEIIYDLIEMNKII